jgi:hypothetical protein
MTTPITMGYPNAYGLAIRNKKIGPILMEQFQKNSTAIL